MAHFTIISNIGIAMMESVNVLLQIKFKLQIDQVHRQIVTALLNPVRRLQISVFFFPFKIWGRRLSGMLAFSKTRKPVPLCTGTGQAVQFNKSQTI